MDLSEVPLMQAASRSMQGILGMVEPSPQDALAADGGFPVFFLVVWLHGQALQPRGY